ncbi:MAG: hypothetical protein Ct9H300mP8_10860 [Gammaproteobacteria bacterium]|nr:MAG: hypothetical protein Ct9H300mP8_10860 [Gammaproteobacteria bacterium]
MQYRAVYRPEHAIELIVAAEEAGFDSAWTVEHTVIPELHASQYPYSKDGRMAGDRYDLPLPDPLIWMAYVAAHTTRIKLGTGILILPNTIQWLWRNKLQRWIS